MLAVMLSKLSVLDAYQFVIAGIKYRYFFHQFLKNKNIALVSNQTTICWQTQLLLW
jgi:hypothetical protein